MGRRSNTQSPPTLSCVLRAKYTTDKYIDSILQMVVKALYNLTSPEDVKSFRKDDDFLKLRLRWKSDAFRLYLGNTTLLADQYYQAMENLVDFVQVS
eukprot:8515056-Ditylum_brightwellii.AAC.1